MTTVKLAIAGLMVLVLGACATGPRVYTDADPATGFGQFVSFAFMEGAGKSGSSQYQTLSGQRIEDAISASLEARGYAVDINNPDLLINFHLKTEEKTRTSPPVYYGGYYGYRSGVYMGWPGYVEPGHIDTYTEGTLSIDLVNRRTNQMVWEGTAVARVTDTSMANTDQAVREAVGAIFAQYPFVAGSSVPVQPAQ